MDHLSKLTPAETLLLLKGENVQLKDLLKVTLMDLFLKQVLQTKEIIPDSETKLSKANPKLYVMQGTHFNLYRPLPHEEVFTELVNANIKIEIPFADCVKSGLKKAKNENYYSRLVLKSETLQPYFERGFLRIFNGKFSLTPTGQEKAKNVRSEMQELEVKFANAMEHDQTKARAIMHEVKGNAFLLKNMDIKMMQEIESQVLTAKNADTRTVSSSFPDVWVWLALDTHFHSFDSSWDNVGDSASDGGFDTDFD